MIPQGQPPTNPFRDLRELRGWTLPMLVERTGLSYERLAQIETGAQDDPTEIVLSELYGLDLDALRDGCVYPGDTPTDSRVFLFHGDISSFNTRDLHTFGRALGYGRLLAHRRRTGFFRRQSMQPQQVVGPHNRDAALQGYRFARLLRSSLSLAGQAVGNFRALLEDQLDIVVTVADLETQHLRAGSILDADRAAGAIVLGNGQVHSAARRVEMAHELCHLLFDPVDGDDQVQLAIDESPEGWRPKSLCEARANGFAAEFLLPFEGLRALLGEPRGAASGEPAMLLSAAQNHFGVPRPIAINHLKNLGYYAEEFRLKLLDEHRHAPRFSVAPEETLPIAGGVPLCLDLQDQAIDSLGAASTTWAQARADRQQWRRETEDEINTVLAESLSLHEQGRYTRSGLRFGKALDQYMYAGKFSETILLLDRLDPSKFHPNATVGFLSYVHLCADLRDDPAYRRFYARVRQSLAETFGWSDEKIMSALVGF